MVAPPQPARNYKFKKMAGPERHMYERGRRRKAAKGDNIRAKELRIESKKGDYGSTGGEEWKQKKSKE